jgi:hypothetical protein
MDSQEYRGRLERFLEDLGRAHCRYYDGSSESLSTRSVFSENSDLFTPDAVRELDAEISATASFLDSRRRSLRRLSAAAVTGRLDAAAEVLREEIAGYESRRCISWAGREVPLSQIDDLLSGETDRDRRFALDEARREAWAGSVALRAGLVSTVEGAAASLGFGSVRGAIEKSRHLDLDLLSRSLEAALARGQLRYLDAIQRSFSSCPGIGRARADWRDLGLWVRHHSAARGFQKETLDRAVGDTIERLAIAPERSGAIEVRSSTRLAPGRALCIAVRVPEAIMVFHSAGEGPELLAARMHEAGHSHHLAWSSPSLAVEERMCGDPALHEAYAFLFEGLASDAGWLAELGATREAEARTRFQRLLRAFSVRLYLAKLQFRLGLSGGDSDEADARYRELLREWTGAEPDGRSHLFASDLTFQSADYLRGWIAEAHLRACLCERFGRDWYRRAAAGRLLKELWETGGRYTAEEIVRELGAGTADPQLLADELDEGLRG